MEMNLGSLSVEWTSNMVYTHCGDKSSRALLVVSGRDSVTLQMCASAAGQFLPSYIEYTGEVVHLEYDIHELLMGGCRKKLSQLVSCSHGLILLFQRRTSPLDSI